MRSMVDTDLSCIGCKLFDKDSEDAQDTAQCQPPSRGLRLTVQEADLVELKACVSQAKKTYSGLILRSEIAKFGQ